jgi:hypothetical protein
LRLRFSTNNTKRIYCISWLDLFINIVEKELKVGCIQLLQRKDVAGEEAQQSFFFPIKLSGSFLPKETPAMYHCHKLS